MSILFVGTAHLPGLLAVTLDILFSSVEVQHDDRGAVGEVSWAQNFTVSVAGVTVDLLQPLIVTSAWLHTSLASGSHISLATHISSL